MNRVHALPTEMDGCTHIEEGQHVTHREERGDGTTTQRVRVELRGGVIEDGIFVGKRGGQFGQRTDWVEYVIGPDRAADYLAFQSEFENDPAQPPRGLEDRAHACRLEYLQRVQLGMRPLPTSPPVTG